LGGDVDEDEVDEEEDEEEVVMSKSMLLLLLVRRLVEFGESELLSCWISLVFMVIGERGSLVADIIMAEVDDCDCDCGGGDGVRTKLLLLSLIDGEWCCCFLSTPPPPPLPEEWGDVRDESGTSPLPPTLYSAVSFSLILDVNVEAVDESPQSNDGLFKLFVIAVDVEAFNVPFLFSNLDF
jgi:hypothetical protein